ncbi:cbb3-type cytochrome oxidase assembly protein CcoS [Pontibacter mangrovi]|uniref:Cbb3-type cytochrome oxidase assembly protein CcoS n=1 Tax=Pontibacter mangrovi TaxID=2589816 RepID=A0A501WBL2_9BACT|nr:cbb3-type cytochrome oxidase assembly protein CcoS [Pontibacter mangrovi]TPE45905.1 cbb3-type cytochrome oxidase assembly protein CcoS [Pontibacter mangrovi]
MFIIFLLIGISVTVATGFLAAFLWAVKSGQYEDDYTPAVRMLFENEPSKATKHEAKPKPH